MCPHCVACASSPRLDHQGVRTTEHIKVSNSASLSEGHRYSFTRTWWRSPGGDPRAGGAALDKAVWPPLGLSLVSIVGRGAFLDGGAAQGRAASPYCKNGHAHCGSRSAVWWGGRCLCRSETSKGRSGPFVRRSHSPQPGRECAARGGDSAACPDTVATLTPHRRDHPAGGRQG